MGRYSSVQAYSDSNASSRKVSYEQVTGSSEAKKAKVTTEKVVNPYGSTAGAGSGEFHVYRAARAREMERMKQLTQAEEEQQKDREFQEKLEQYKTEEEARTEKRRKKRQRQKEAKLRKKNLEKAGISTEVAAKSTGADCEEVEFTYTPIHKQNAEAETTKTDKEVSSAEAKVEFANDGSFLEMMKRKLESEQAAKQEKDDDDEGEPPCKRQAT